MSVRMVSDLFTIPAPVKGLNAYDSIATMPEASAVVLRNFFPQPYGCQVRKGYVKHCAISGAVETLMSHTLGNPKLYAFASNKLYDVTNPNAAPVDKTGTFVITNSRWQHTNFVNAAGVHMVAVNGQDFPLWFKPDGSIVQMTVLDITGADPKTFIHVVAHQKRLWFVQKASSLGWYLPVEVIIGAVLSFDFGGLFSRGGFLNQLATWTLDDGDGADDHLVGISSEGEIAVYSGIDPNEAATWTLKGVYYIGSPLGRRCATKYGGELAILTQNGLVALGDKLKSTKVNPAGLDIGRNVQRLISSAADINGDGFGWQPFICPQDNMLYVNIPADDFNRYQLVLNDITHAWAQFVGYNAYCWELHKDRPFFGTDSFIHRAWEQNTDAASVLNDGTVVNGDTIYAESQTSFSFFGTPGFNKHFKMVRPTIIGDGQFKMSVSANPNYSFAVPPAPVGLAAINVSYWDVDLWDVGIWKDSVVTFKDWISVTGIGSAGALSITMASAGETLWVTTDWLVETGGVM